MGRNASEMTVAIRNLLDENNFEITHKEARPKLIEAGFDVAPEANNDFDSEISEFKKVWVEVKKTHEFNPKNEEHIDQLLGIAADQAVTTFNWSKQKANKVVAEFKNRLAFKAEKNAFDVIKYNHKNKKPSKPSSKPDAAPAEARVNAAAKVANRVKTNVGVVKGPLPKHQPAAASGADVAAAIQWVKDNGGLSSVKSVIAEMQRKVALVEQELRSLLADAA
jgi:hypothetical protein